jgi:hypothetical protein
VRVRPDGLHAFDDAGDLLFGRPLFHHDHHLSLSLSKLVRVNWQCGCGAASGGGDVRVGGHSAAAAGPDA